MNIATAIGIIGAICTSTAFMPQVIKIVRTKHVADLSLPMYSIFSFGTLCWLIYGILIKSGPVIAANCMTFALSVYILAMIVRYR